MGVGAAVRPARWLPAFFESDGAKPALVAVAYLVGAELAFVVGTLSDKIFAPFWPPNIVLFYALALTPIQRWWLYILATFPAHVVAELGIGMGWLQLLVAFATNGLIAVINALAVKYLLGEPPWFNNVRGASVYILVAALVVPAVVALGGAFVPITGGGGIDRYWTFWAQWFLSNALGALTLGSAAFIWLGRDKLSVPTWRRVEAIALAAALVVVCALAFELGAESVPIGFLPALLYSPLPLILWAAVRFGARGASGAVLIVTVVLTWRALNGPSLFVAGDAETNVFALQVFLLALSIPVLLLGTAIEEARRAERTTREREEQMAFAAASANIGLWQYDHAGDRFWATEHCRDMLAVPRDAPPPTWEAIRNGVQPEDRDALTDLIRAARIESPAEHEFRVRDPDGGIRWIAARARTELDANGSPVRVSGLFTDITPRKVAEHEIDVQRRELAHLMRVGMVGELSGAIAHELNQPLTAILANAQAARRMLTRTSPDTRELEEALDDIVRDDHRAGEVIGRLRGLLKKDAGRFERVHLNGLVEAALKLLHSELVSRMVKVEVDLQPDLPAAYGDPVQLQQVLLNLVMNGIEAMSATAPGNRVVTITTRSTGNDRIAIVVADRGCGLSPEATSRLFEPYFTTKEHGLGLGLSICSTIVKSYGGELALAGNADGGATATMTLPERVHGVHEKKVAAT